MRAVRSLFVVAAVLAVAGFATDVEAQDQRARARQLYGEAQALFDAGNFAQAEASFRAAYEAVPNPVVLRAIASAQEHQGNIAGAIETLEHYLRDSPNATDRAEVESRLATFRSRPAMVAIASTPSGAQIIVDGQDTGHVTPHEVSMPGGTHTVEVRLAGHTATSQTFEAQAATRVRLELSLDAEADPLGTEGGDQQAAPEDTQPSDDDGGSGDPSAGVWVFAGIGAATLIAGTVFGFLALSEQSNFDTDPNADAADRGEAFALVADISFGVAAASVIAAIILYIVERAEADSDSAAIVAPFATRSGGGVAAQLRF